MLGRAPRILNEMVVRLCVLDDPARWAAYLAVRDAGRPLTRAELPMRSASRHKLAAFHLEKLLSEGFLEATYERGERVGGCRPPGEALPPHRPRTRGIDSAAKV